LLPQYPTSTHALPVEKLLRGKNVSATVRPVYMRAAAVIRVSLAFSTATAERIGMGVCEN
jgi:hypothetical protein